MASNRYNSFRTRGDYMATRAHYITVGELKYFYEKAKEHKIKGFSVAAYERKSGDPIAHILNNNSTDKNKTIKCKCKE